MNRIGALLKTLTPGDTLVVEASTPQKVASIKTSACYIARVFFKRSRSFSCIWNQDKGLVTITARAVER